MERLVDAFGRLQDRSAENRRSRLREVRKEPDLPPNLFGPLGNDLRLRLGPWLLGSHLGVDIATSAGTPVRSIGDGEIITAGWSNGWGNVVTVKHFLADKTVIYSNYAHLSKILVTKGDSVSAGKTVGEVGNTGNSYGNHLHFQIDTTAQAHPYYYVSCGKGLDPLSVVNKGLCRDFLTANTIDPIAFLESGKVSVPGGPTKEALDAIRNRPQEKADRTHMKTRAEIQQEEIEGIPQKELGHDRARHRNERSRRRNDHHLRPGGRQPVKRGARKPAGTRARPRIRYERTCGVPSKNRRARRRKADFHDSRTQARSVRNRLQNGKSGHRPTNRGGPFRRRNENGGDSGNPNPERNPLGRRQDLARRNENEVRYAPARSPLRREIQTFDTERQGEILQRFEAFGHRLPKRKPLRRTRVLVRRHLSRGPFRQNADLLVRPDRARGFENRHEKTDLDGDGRKKTCPSRIPADSKTPTRTTTKPSPPSERDGSPSKTGTSSKIAKWWGAQAEELLRRYLGYRWLKAGRRFHEKKGGGRSDCGVRKRIQNLRRLRPDFPGATLRNALAGQGRHLDRKHRERLHRRSRRVEKRRHDPPAPLRLQVERLVRRTLLPARQNDQPWARPSTWRKRSGFRYEPKTSPSSVSARSRGWRRARRAVRRPARSRGSRRRLPFRVPGVSPRRARRP
jgi:hypothetical protein